MKILENSDVAQRLSDINWDFPQSKTSGSIHSIHPYPAKFIPEIPRYLIESLPISEDTAILDPFCGSGVTLVEAQMRGLKSVGIDLNPIACLISKVKTQDLPAEFLNAADHCVNFARKGFELTGTRDIPNIDHWFDPQIQQSVTALLLMINSIKEVAIRRALRLALSSILVRISKQESDTRYAAIQKDVSQEDVFEFFTLACRKIANAKERNSSAKMPVKIINRDILATEPSEIPWPIGLVITSPPYPNAYEYWLYHKYRMWWLGFDPIAVKEKEIGARAHFFKKNHHTAKDFKNQMVGTLGLIQSVLVPGGYACFVIGRSKIHGKIVDNASIIENVAEKSGLKKIERITRRILASRKSFNLSHANIKTEEILILKK